MTAATLNKKLEDDVKMLAQRVVDEMLHMQPLLGDLPPFADDSKRSPEVEAALYLPYWWVYGNAEPEVAGPFWDSILKGIDPVTGKVDPNGGPDAADQWAQRMLKMWETVDPPYAVLARQVMPPDVEMDYRVFLQTRLHLGEVKPPTSAYLKGGKLPEPAKPEPGDAVTRLRELLAFGKQGAGAGASQSGR